MSAVTNFNTLSEVAADFRKDLTGDNRKKKSLILLFAHNGTGKTRLSMEFKELGKTEGARDTLYFNAFTEDLFSWNNDLEHNETRELRFNTASSFFDILRGQGAALERRIESFYQNYVDLMFDIDYEKAKVTFSRNIKQGDSTETVENIKISRGEENLFIWSFFLAICQLAIDKDPAYSWVKYIYIDDPISSLDENKVIAVACDLANLVKTENNQTKTVISTHHSLFFNVMYNETKGIKHKFYYLHASKPSGYKLQDTGDSPFFHHIAVLSRLEQAKETGEIYTYHFNELRTILEKTASFFGYDKINKCIHGLDDEVLFERALHLFSHGKYSVFDPREMGADNKDLFKRILEGFLDKYEFDLPNIFNEAPSTVAD